MMNIRKGEFFCPKFMGLPDMVRYSIPESEDKLLFPKTSSFSDDISEIKNYLPMCDTLGVSTIKMKAALKKAKKSYKEYRKLSTNGFTAKEVFDFIETGKVLDKNSENNFLSIGLMGYVYDLYDEFISMGIVNRLKESGIRVQTFEMFDENILDNQLKGMKKRYSGLFLTNY